MMLIRNEVICFENHETDLEEKEKNMVSNVMASSIKYSAINAYRLIKTW